MDNMVQSENMGRYNANSQLLHFDSMYIFYKKRLNILKKILVKTFLTFEIGFLKILNKNTVLFPFQ